MDTHGLWQRTAPPAPATRALDATRRVDVAIVGAGFTGLSAALHLAQAGVRAIVLEGQEIGFGGSGRNVGLVNAGMWVLPDDIPKALGEVHGGRLLTMLGDAPSVVRALVERHKIDCDLVMQGTLHCAPDAAGERELRQRAEQWQRRGAPVEFLGADETRARIGSSAYRASLLDRRAGTIQPLSYVRGLARAALDAGAEIYTQSPVIDVAAATPGWSVRTGRGEVLADWIVVATNAYTVAPWPQLRAELVHLPYFNIATAPLPADALRTILPERQGAWDTRQVLSSFRLDRLGRLVFGSVGALRGTGTAIHRAWAARALRRLFPQLADVQFETDWYGMIGMTQDNVPRFHRLAPHVVGFSGYNGRGIAPGTVFGRALAEHITGRISEDALPLPVTDPAAASMRGIKEFAYEYGAQLVHATQARF